ncbi:MAG: cytochrome c [Bdellovibrio sp.]|nr:cytochrome c [Bdellovibrio sp.]
MKISVWLFLIMGLGPLGCVHDPNEKGMEILPDMIHSVAYEAYSENPLTPDKKTMMLPVKGTVARGHMPYMYLKTPEDAIRSGIELVNSTQVNEKTLARGQSQYETYCLVCHGVTGQGDGPLIPKMPNPPSYTSKTFLTYPDGRIFNAITVGFGDMESYANQINEQDRWYIVNYIRTLQKKKVP